MALFLFRALPIRRTFTLPPEWIVFGFIASFFCLPAHAQPLREFGTCDSTKYHFNEDTTVIAGRYALYYESNQGIALVYSFESEDPDRFIRDFDIIRPNLWYTVVGARYTGERTDFFRSTDRGQSWVLDTSYFAAVTSDIGDVGFDPQDPYYYDAINQLQHLGQDTLLLFLGYYNSGIVYSVDGGTSWAHWFANIPANYQGLFECAEYYYLFQLSGDGFPGRMFPFRKDYLFRNDEWVNFSHQLSGSGHHPPFIDDNHPEVLYFGFKPECQTYSFLQQHIDSTCTVATPSFDLLSETAFSADVYPNPAKGSFYVRLSAPPSAAVELFIFNGLGQTVIRQAYPAGNQQLQVEHTLQSGIYLLWLKIGHRRFKSTVQIVDFD